MNDLRPASICLQAPSGLWTATAFIRALQKGGGVHRNVPSNTVVHETHASHFGRGPPQLNRIRFPRGVILSIPDDRSASPVLNLHHRIQSYRSPLRQHRIPYRGLSPEALCQLKWMQPNVPWMGKALPLIQNPRNPKVSRDIHFFTPIK